MIVRIKLIEKVTMTITMRRMGVRVRVMMEKW